MWKRYERNAWGSVKFGYRRAGSEGVRSVKYLLEDPVTRSKVEVIMKTFSIVKVNRYGWGYSRDDREEWVSGQSK